MNEEREISTEINESGAKTCAGNPELVQVSCEMFDFGSATELAGFQCENKRHNSERNEAIVEKMDGICVEEGGSFSKFKELSAFCESSSGKQSAELELEKRSGNFEGNDSVIGKVPELNDGICSCRHVSENQSVVDGVKKGNEMSETLLNLNCNHELVELELEKRMNGDALSGSLKAGPMDVRNVDDGLKASERFNNRNGKSDSDLVGVTSRSSNSGLRKFVYSREEMEALRVVNLKAQKRFWQKIHKGLEKTIKQEYDELGNSKHHKHVNRHPNAKIRSYNGQIFQGEISAEDITCDKEAASSVDFTCDDVEKGEDSSALVQEWSEQGSDDEYESFQRPAFFVEGEPDFESGPPEDGLEYLRRVRWEASHIPKVKMAKIDSNKLKKEQSVYMPKIPDIEKCPPHLVPSKQWEDEFIADFSELRLGLSHLEDMSETSPDDPYMITFSLKEHKGHSSKNQASSLELPTGVPSLSTITALEPATRAGMLKKRISLFESASNLSKNECVWLFALCASVETPLDADTCASLRCLLRRCAKLRAGKSELDDEVAMLNILATISGKFFRQSEI